MSTKWLLTMRCRPVQHASRGWSARQSGAGIFRHPSGLRRFIARGLHNALAQALGLFSPPLHSSAQSRIEIGEKASPEVPPTYCHAADFHARVPRIGSRTSAALRPRLPDSPALGRAQSVSRRITSSGSPATPTRQVRISRR